VIRSLISGIVPAVFIDAKYKADGGKFIGEEKQ